MKFPVDLRKQYWGPANYENRVSKVAGSTQGFGLRNLLSNIK